MCDCKLVSLSAIVYTKGSSTFDAHTRSWLAASCAASSSMAAATVDGSLPPMGGGANLDDAASMASGISLHSLLRRRRLRVEEEVNDARRHAGKRQRAEDELDEMANEDDLGDEDVLPDGKVREVSVRCGRM